MPRFAANLSMMFTEWDFLDRFAVAADAGFDAVEYLFPYAFPAGAIAARLEANGLTQALFNAPPGNWDAGERGIAALPGRFGEFADGIARAMDYARATGVGRVHVMAGIADSGDAEARAAYERAVRHAAERFAGIGVDVLLEPINRRSMPGYFLNDFGFAADLIGTIGAPNLGLQFDMFHRQILHGDVAEGFRALKPLVRHVQVASVPSRHEPDGEELNYAYLFGLLDALSYDGFVGCEYNPRAGTLAGLDWFRRLRA